MGMHRKRTHVETLKARPICVEGSVVEVSELLRDGVDISHGAIGLSYREGGDEVEEKDKMLQD